MVKNETKFHYAQKIHAAGIPTSGVLPGSQNNKMVGPDVRDYAKKLIPALCVSLLALTSASFTQAAVSQAEANRLGNSLTPFGAVRSGNSAGTIPRWTGGDTTRPDGYEGTGTTTLTLILTMSPGTR